MKSNQALSGRPSAPAASNTGRPYGNQRHSSVSSTDNKANVASISGMPRSGVSQATMTPVQQKLSQNMFGNNAVINNYLTSGQRVLSDSQAQASLQDSNNVNPLLYLNQFKQASNLKKSEIKQLQKYCEQNGLDFQQVLHDSQGASSHQHQKSNQSSKSQSKERLSVNGPQANLPLAYLIQGGSSQQAVARATAGQKGQAQGSQRIMMKHNQTPQQHYGASVHHSNSTTAIERSPLISSSMHSQKSQHLMLNNSNQGYASQANLHQQQQIIGAQGQFVQHTSASVNSSGNKQSSSQGRSLVANQPQQQQLLRGADWKKPMIPSQMSINSVLRPNNSSGDPGASSSKFANVQQMKSVGSKGQQREGGQGANFSASNGYFSQKSSPVGRLSLDRGAAAELVHKGPQAGTKNSKYARQQPHVTPGPKANKSGSNKPMHGGNIGRRHDSTGNVPSKNDLASAYSNPRRVSVPSQAGANHPSNSATNSVERKQQIDSGAGVISGSGGPTLAPQNQLIQRKDVSGFQRGIQVEIKAAAVQSRRKHGSIDAYKQGSANNHSGSTSSIRQGQGEIAPQRASVVASKPLHPKNPIFAKFNATPSSNQQQKQQLPNVVRSQINSNVSTQGQTTAHGKAGHQSHTNSMPSIQNSGQKQGAGGHRPSSPSDEIRYQSSNYTNGALSRGSVKQSSQHGLSGSNQMNLSLSQSSQQHHKSHKVNSVEQLQERRIAYEASQGKMANAQAQQKYQQAMMPSVKSNSNEMLLAYAQQNLHGPAGATPQEGLTGGASDPKVSSIVLSQASKPSPGYSNRHSRIKAKSNQSSLEHNKDSRERKPTEQSAANYQDQLLADRPGTAKKRGTVTAAQNSPRHHLFDRKDKQPHFPEQTPLTSKQQQPHPNSNQAQKERKLSAYKQLQSNEKQPSSNFVGKQIQNKSSSLVPKSDSQGRLIPSTSDFANAALQQHILDEKAHGSDQRRASAGNMPQMTEEEYLNLVRQQQSSAQSQLYQRLDDQSAGSIEQYSRKLHTPNPILDGGTGAGGATTLQDQTRQLLREQREILDKLGLPQQTQHSDSQQVFGNYSTEINSQGRMLQQVSGVKPNIQQPKTPSMYPPPPQSNDHSMLSVASAQTMQQQRVIASSHSKHQQQNQSITNIENKVLNLSDIISGGKINSKDVQTKTSAQTTNTASTHKHVVNPKFLQYAAGAQSIQQPQNPVQSGKNASAKLKKSLVGGPQGPQNLIMHQNVPGKRSNSQEIVIPNNGSKKSALQQQSAGKQQVNYSQADLMNAQVQGGDPRHNFVLARKHQQNQVADRSAAASKNQLRHSTNSNTNSSKMHNSKAEKRSSSQPTAAVSGVQYHQGGGSRGTADFLYHEYEQRLQHQHGRAPEDPTHSRQGAGARSSQQAYRKSEKHETHRVSDQQPNSHPLGQQQQQVRPGSKALLQARIEPRAAQQQAQQASRPQSLNNVVVEAPAQSKGPRKNQPNAAAGVRHNIAKLQKESSNIQKRLRKQSSVPQLHQNVSSVHDRSDLSKSTISAKHSTAGMRKSQSNGPGRPQYSVNQPHAVAMPESSISDVEQRRLITEEDEQEIRQVASDINEQAFYGKIIRTKKAMKVESEFAKLSPRSQEIGYVMQKVERTFAETQGPPVTDISFYRIGKMLGRGAFGKVNLAMHKLVRKLVALKSLNKHELTDEVQKAKLMKEVNLLLKLRHNHVVKIYETIETKKHIIIVMELCAGGDLLNYVRKRRRLKEPFAQKIFKQIIDGLSYIHSKNIAHRDIKLDNILLDGKGNVKIADFGVSRQIMQDQVMREQCGTPAYIAPEILRNRGYGLNVDLWSAGVVLFAMLYGTVPFKAQTMEELHSLILKGKYLLKEDISSEARDLLRGLLEIDPRRRISIRRIHKHPWLRNLDPTVQLFNDEERKMIKKEYTYNDGSRYNRNENEEPVDCFTQHNLESQYSTLKNHDSKSIILAPFNSTMSEESPARASEERAKVMGLMEIKQQVLRFSKKCREIDRQYEFNNNGQLDNGVYHKVVANNSFEQQDKFEETQGIEIEQTLHDSYRNQAARKGKSASNARNNNQLLASEPSSFLSNSAINYNIEHNPNKSLDPAKVQKLVSFGYPEPYVLQQMREMHPNYCTAGYYLLEMDQNYC